MAITAVLSTFQEATVMYVTDPRSGLASAVQWLPSVAEVSKACEDREAYLAKQADYDRRFAGRVAMPRLPRVTRDPGQEFEAMFEKCGRPLGLNERGTKWEQCVGQGRKIPPVGFKHVAAEWKSPTDEQLRARYGTKAEEAK